mgnify:CR=1 FL=1
MNAQPSAGTNRNQPRVAIATTQPTIASARRCWPAARPAPVAYGGPVRTPVLLVLVGIVSVQFGAGVAKSLFDEISPTAIVWLRLATSTVVLLAIARPRVRGRSRADWTTAVGFGLALGTMNWAIYQSFARIPLGLAVTIEFVGPLLLAVIGFRRPRDLAWVVLAGVGVLLLGLGDGRLTAAGTAFALLAGAAWAAYILLSARTGARWEGLDGLAVASTLATAVLTPFVLTSSPEVLGDAAALVPDDDPAALAAALEGVLTDDAERAERVEAGRVRAARFSWSATADALAAVYRDLAA